MALSRFILTIFDCIINRNREPPGGDLPLVLAERGGTRQVVGMFDSLEAEQGRTDRLQASPAPLYVWK